MEWTNKELKYLRKLRKDDGKNWQEIGTILKKSSESIRKKYARINWAAFDKDPDKNPTVARKWTHEEMVQLDSFLLADCSYDFIAEKLGRSIPSVEKQAQNTDWKAWRNVANVSISEEDNSLEKAKNQMVMAILTVCRYDSSRVDDISKSKFLSKINMQEADFSLDFEEIKDLATERLIELGFGNPEKIELGKGTYVIVGDSHGKHTQKNMFAMLKQVNQFLKPNKIIHIGHILDDDDDISYEWGEFHNLIILSKIEELKKIQEQRNKYNFSYDIIRESISFGELNVCNQDIISDYVKTPINSLDSQIFDEKAIVNCHRTEFFTRCNHVGSAYLASPGCLCEKHTIRTIKQIDFADGRVVKQAFWDGFSKYRRMNHMNKYWENGLLIVHVAENGKHTIIPCPIKKSDKGFTIAYFDKMISSEGVFDPDKKIFVQGDLHCDMHDCHALDVQEKICHDYKPDEMVNLGDTLNYASLNHHVMDRGGVITDKKILDEAAETSYVLRRISKWSKKSHLIYGNHERFSKDFVEKYPQFGMMLDFDFICDLQGIGYSLTPLKEVLKIGSAKFIHGDIKMFGQNGSKLEKAARTFGRDVFVGHIHCPEIRFGCYSVGLSGLLDQHYNEPTASKWIHGFGLCNQYKGESWPTTIALVDNTCYVNKKKYTSTNPTAWKLKKYRARIVYDF